MQSSKCNIEIYCTIVSVVKYREIFQVYNNTGYRSMAGESGSEELRFHSMAVRMYTAVQIFWSVT